MQSESKAPWGLKLAVAAGLAFLHLPILLIIVYAFNVEESAFTFPPPGFTLEWFPKALAREDVMESVMLSIKVATGATLMATLLGTLSAMAVHFRRFPGRDGLNLLFNLPIALPGIITGIALLSSIRLFGLEPSTLTIIIGHTTFCVVMVYNTVLARLRRTPMSLIEASMDLGADGWQTFRRVLLPGLSSAILAGAILAFALSFDEIIVTTFTAGAERTLPIWLLNQLTRPRDMPITNVVALMVIAVTTLPILWAWKLTAGTESVDGASK